MQIKAIPPSTETRSLLLEKHFSEGKNNSGLLANFLKQLPLLKKKKRPAVRAKGPGPSCVSYNTKHGVCSLIVE